jgi:hypothetical protein
MLDAEFAINARPETVSQDFRRTLRPWGYLVPPGGLTKPLTATLKEFCKAGVPLIVDNGHFDDITRVSTSLGKAIGAAKADIATVEARLERTALWRDLSKTVARKRVRLAAILAAEALNAEGMPLIEQLELASNAVIGAEDITAALWLRAEIDTPAIPGRRTELRHRNEAVARQAKLAIDSLPRNKRPQYLAVASALDYDTAYDAGRAFGDAGLRSAAMGFGAFMADNSFSDRIVIQGRAHPLPSPLPMRYLRTALVARGFWDGWKSATRSAPRQFHFLGLGAPIVIPLMALAGYGTPLLTFDATSPIRDAVEGTLYSSLGAYLKIRTRRVAELLMSGQSHSWICPCGFCREFVRKHPFDYVRGRKWGKARVDSGPITAKDLQPSGGLYKAYPLMAEPRGGELRKEVSYARSGHNHWVLHQIMRDVRKYGKRRSTLERHTQRIVDEYQKSTSSSHFADAVSLALDIVRGRFAG